MLDAADLIEKEMGELQKENSALREGMKTLQEESSHLKTRLSDSWKENDRLSKLLYGEYKPHAHISKGSEEEQLKDTVPEENDEWKCSLCGNPTTHYDTTTCENYCEQCGTSADIDFPVPNEALKDLLKSLSPSSLRIHSATETCLIFPSYQIRTPIQEHI